MYNTAPVLRRTLQTFSPEKFNIINGKIFIMTSETIIFIFENLLNRKLNGALEMF
jgi:hypothetical protein